MEAEPRWRRRRPSAWPACDPRPVRSAASGEGRTFHRRLASSQAGFLLPLASGGSLLLLLSCLSLQSLIWGRQLAGRTAWQQRQLEDRLGSAAQRIALAFNGSQQCLLLVPSSAWSDSPALPAGCGAGVDPAPLLRNQLPDGEVRLISWEPPMLGSQDPALGRLTLTQEGGRSSLAPQRHYSLQLAGQPLRVIGIQELDR